MYGVTAAAEAVAVNCPHTQPAARVKSTSRITLLPMVPFTVMCSAPMTPVWLKALVRSTGLPVLFKSFMVLTLSRRIRYGYCTAGRTGQGGGLHCRHNQ